MIDIITKARTQMLVDDPFWGSLAMHLRIVPYAGCTTMATDGTHLYYNPAYPNRPGDGAEADQAIVEA